MQIIALVVKKCTSAVGIYNYIMAYVVNVRNKIIKNTIFETNNNVIHV